MHGIAVYTCFRLARERWLAMAPGGYRVPSNFSRDRLPRWLDVSGKLIAVRRAQGLTPTPDN